MRKLIVVLLIIILPLGVSAQTQMSPQNHEVIAYQQLLTEANDRLAKTVAQNQQLNVELQSLRAKLIEKKPEPPKPDSK